MSFTDTAIIGAGPYGLSLSAHLSAAGVVHQILGQPMRTWINFMPRGMLLRSEAFASNLHAPLSGFTLEDYYRQKGMRYQPMGMELPLETFVDYARWFQSNLVEDVQAVDVVNLRRVDGHFQLALSDGRSLLARKVVIALGLKGFAQTPVALRGLPERYASHSALYGDLAWAQGKDVAIVGGGQSALGLAALLYEQGSRVHVLMREAGVIWHPRPQASRGILSRLARPDAGLGRGWRSLFLSEYPGLFHMLDQGRRKQIMERSYGASGAWWLRDRVVGKVKISFRTEVRSAAIDNDQVMLRVISEDKESAVAADHVIAATGFKTDMRQHAFLSKEIVDAISINSGLPELTSNFETQVRGLYVIGPASAHSFGPVMRFVYGARHAAPGVARHIAHSLKADARDGVWSSAEGHVLERTGE
ncbi:MULTISPECIES: NAD(P)-binding domain-containing protein [Paraburkholderia]|uniref:NAD(P)-binding domain-containing protein n=1 Tax=Paraburkholderia TaxID=1822464 RepID=UPI002259809C|nr:MULTISPECIES: NAD(P)-binding domain-containing protein [Paraburkholderia]MCX4173964.1 NAD(P)-binding domain-containing protein [Paraburkholderia madseniana]MDQ6461968.1 NAD(P)-binding domain-containing protein [Paraburkholderia madseniana]